MNEQRKNMLFAFAGIIICIIVFSLLIYPGIYKYDKFNQTLPVKINRFTGHTEVLTSNGWEEFKNTQTETSPAN